MGIALLAGSGLNLAAPAAQAATCQALPAKRAEHWSYRVNQGQRCWYPTSGGKRARALARTAEIKGQERQRKPEPQPDPPKPEAPEAPPLPRPRPPPITADQFEQAWGLRAYAADDEPAPIPQQLLLEAEAARVEAAPAASDLIWRWILLYVAFLIAGSVAIWLSGKLANKRKEYGS